ncbi:MAG: Si-specific NAD(P)(+) transhydrogenase [Polyangiaceae bacterium]|nr:Si-specific NAD(P)(+) transhydrogenase [Polyangiaceae bacterium]
MATPGDAERFDLVILGCGPAGEKAAAQAAFFGKRVAVVEREPEPGGAGVHTGTLPSKTLRETAIYLSGHRSRSLYGVAISLEPDATVPRLMARKKAIARAESGRIRANLDRHGVSYFRGAGRFTDAHTVEVVGAEGSRLLHGDFILLATGSRPRRPPEIDFDDELIHDSDEILTITQLPRSLTILGAGVIGCEYACMFAALGVEVVLADTRPDILPFLDKGIVARLTRAMEALGVRFELGVSWGKIARTGDRITTELKGREPLVTEQLLFAAGRTGNADTLQLERVGLEMDKRGYVPVDAAYRTKVPHILAAGDAIGFPALASVSMEQGRVAVCHAFGFEYKKAVAELMPYGVYTIPEVSAVGETEETCRERGIDYVVGEALYRDNARGQITGDLEGVTKLVVRASDRLVLGVHVIGERASELVHIGQAVIQLGGKVDVFIDMVFNHPTLSESYKYAAYQCLGALAARGRS